MKNEKSNKLVEFVKSLSDEECAKVIEAFKVLEQHGGILNMDEETAMSHLRQAGLVKACKRLV